MPSFYQSDLFRALVELGGIDLEVIFAGSIPAARVELGWQNDLAGYPHHFLNSKFKIIHAMYLAWKRRKRIHVVGGLWGEKAFAAALIILAVTRSRFAVYSEAPMPDAPRSIFKRGLRAVFGRLIISRTAGVFPISRFGSDFFKALGVRDGLVYPFGYFRRTASEDLECSRGAGEKIEVVYVGQLIQRKGLDLLLDAIAPLLRQSWRLSLSIVGTGEEASNLRKQAVALGINDRVNFEGSLQANAIPSKLRKAHLAVLPSRWDGWGLVANEALSAGVPVIVSDRCGAADLIQNGRNGYVFRSEDVVDLRNCLEDFLTRENDWPRFKHNAAVIGRSLSAETAASYFLDCIRHMSGELSHRPTPPWQTSSAEADRLEQPRANMIH